MRLLRLPLACLFAAVTAGCGSGSSGDGTAVPDALPSVDALGQPIDVGLLILGHSTSQVGDWPGKLATALNATGADPRNYVVFRAVTEGDGGFLWTVDHAAPGEVSYRRFEGSEQDTQWCEDATAVRWSCRRTKLIRGLTGTEPAPAESAAAQTGCGAPRILSCVWHDASGEHVEPDADFHSCWTRMDVRIALIQDTSNRSWPVADYDGDGDADAQDFWPQSHVVADAATCPDSSGLIGGQVDWNCDARLDADDAPVRVYAGWLERLSQDLLDGFGAGDGVDLVFLSGKPLEVQNCERWYPHEPACGPHQRRVPTADAPFDRYYLPSVYWEIESLRTLLADPGRDPRIRGLTAHPEDMWDYSERCYGAGLGTGDWSIPEAAPRPRSVQADDEEDDDLPGSASSVGCMLEDHVHHTAAGGWMMADVWYAGLLNALKLEE